MADSSPYIGSIMMFAGNFAPRNFALCQGQLLPISQYTALFSILGTTFGGDGRTTFALPDLRGRAPNGSGQGPGLPDVVLGQQSGQASVTLLSTQLPVHNHTAGCNTGMAGVQSPSGAMFASQGSLTEPVNAYSSGAANATMKQTMTGITGGGQPVSIANPMLGLNFIIAIQGIFPSRN